MPMTHKLSALVAVCLTAVSNGTLVFYISVFGCVASLMHQVSPCRVAVFLLCCQLHLPRQKPKVNCCFSLMALCHKLRARSWLREKRYWFFSFFWWLPEPRWPKMKKKKKKKTWQKFQKGFTARRLATIRLRWWFLLSYSKPTEDNSGCCGYIW